MVNCAELAVIHIKRGSKYKARMSVERFPISFGLTGAEAEPCPCIPILPFTLDPESSSVLILNTSASCSLASFLSRSFFPIFSAAEVPDFLNLSWSHWHVPLYWCTWPHRCPNPALISVLVLCSIWTRCLSWSHLMIDSSNCLIRSLVLAKQKVLLLCALFTHSWCFLAVSFIFWCPCFFLAYNVQFHQRSAFVFTPHCTNLSLQDWAPFSALSCWSTLGKVVSILCRY